MRFRDISVQELWTFLHRCTRHPYHPTDTRTRSPEALAYSHGVRVVELGANRLTGTAFLQWNNVSVCVFLPVSCAYLSMVEYQSYQCCSCANPQSAPSERQVSRRSIEITNNRFLFINIWKNDTVRSRRHSSGPAEKPTF